MAKKKAPPSSGNSELPVSKATDVINQFLDNTQKEFLSNVFQNGSLGGALGFPQNQGFAGTAEVSNSTTLFKNLRWYFVSNFRQLLNECYVEIGLIQTIVDVPVDDAFRGGIDITSEQLGEESIEELQLALDRDDDLGICAQACKWNRLFGGAGVIAATDQIPEKPLNAEILGPEELLRYKAADLWELFFSRQNIDGFDSLEDDDYDSDWFDYYGIELHKTRVKTMKGIIAPSFVRPRLRGWGLSVVEVLVRSINQYLKGSDLTFEVLDEFKIDVFKMKNLINTLLSPNGEDKVRKRIQLANWNKNYQNALVMDSEDDYDHKQLSFAGLAEAQQGIRMQVASDMRMPMIKLFGTPATGLGADDEESLEVYNSMVESDVRKKARPVLRWMLELKCQKLFGFIPDDLDFKFKSLRVLGAVDEEVVKNHKFDRLYKALDKGAISLKEFRENCNTGKLFDTQLNTKSNDLNPEELGVVDEAEDQGESEKETV